MAMFGNGNWHENYQDAPLDGSSWNGNDNSRLLRGGSWNNNIGFRVIHLQHFSFVRTIKWEFNGRILEESSPMPVVQVTEPKHQNKPDNLVGSPNSYLA
jgi:hypothetical protein